MEIGEEDQPLAEEEALLLDGLLDLDHHLRVAPDSAVFTHDLSAGILVLRIGKARERAGLCLDQNRVASLGEGFHTCRGNADAGFVVFDLSGNADDHVGSCKVLDAGWGGPMLEKPRRRGSLWRREGPGRGCVQVQLPRIVRRKELAMYANIVVKRHYENET